MWNSSVYPTPGQWFHVVTTYDGTTATIYVDGVNVGSGPRSLNTSPLCFASGPIHDGRRAIDGQVDDFAIWNCSLTSGEVAALYAWGQAGNVLCVAKGC